MDVNSVIMLNQLVHLHVDLMNPIISCHALEHLNSCPAESLIFIIFFDWLRRRCISVLWDRMDTATRIRDQNPARLNGWSILGIGSGGGIISAMSPCRGRLSC